ncbi:MAG TPA: NAD-binding protein [Thermoanaerobaculia bacterium]|nr:NAD-binding protein [Thermoanaerobaculia bacterium]
MRDRRPPQPTPRHDQDADAARHEENARTPAGLRDVTNAGKWSLVFKLAHHDKDIRIAASLAHQQHASTPMLALTQQLFSGALHQLGEGADYIEVAKIVAKMNGTRWE